jgi:hypothetical protein
VSKYGGIGIERSKAAIDRLIRDGLVRCGDGHTRTKPRYELILPNPGEEREGADTRIWLPNAVVTGTAANETPPIQRIRSAGDVWTLRLFVDLYDSHNLRDDGGISPQVLWQEFERICVAEQGVYVVWGFKLGKYRKFDWKGPFPAHAQRPQSKTKPHPVWESVTLLEQMGLLAFVPHLFENDTPQAEMLHPYGTGRRGAEPIENEIGDAADAAARVIAAWNLEHAEQKGFEYFCPVVRTLPKVKMIGIARLHYRPQTGRTAAWFGQLHEKGQGWIATYKKLRAKSEASSPDVARWG